MPVIGNGGGDMTDTRDLTEAIIIVGDDVPLALVCLHAADLGQVDLEGYGFGVDHVPYLESPDGLTRINLPSDSYATAVLAMDMEAIKVRKMDLDGGTDTDYSIHFLDRAPASGMGAR